MRKWWAQFPKLQLFTSENTLSKAQNTSGIICMEEGAKAKCMPNVKDLTVEEFKNLISDAIREVFEKIMEQLIAVK